MNGCAAPDCKRPHEARGLCHLHYMRWYRNGGYEITAPRSHTPQVVKDAALADYFAGMALTEVGETYGIHPATVYWWLKEQGTKPRGYTAPKSAIRLPVRIARPYCKCGMAEGHWLGCSEAAA